MLAAAALLWAASAVVWASQRYQTPFTGEKTFGATGAVLRPELVPLALAALAAVAAVLATGGLLRRLMGVLVAAAGGVLAWRALDWFASGWFTFGAPDIPPASMPIGQPSPNPAGPVLMSVAAVVLIVAGLLVALVAHRMPAMGAKYSAPGTRKPKSHDPDKQLWEALDEGEDPTEGEPGRD